jgi:hypothetical protein
MSLPESIMEKLQDLPAPKQEQVLRFVESLLETSPTQAAREEPIAHPWVQVALSLNLDGPSDWSRKFEDYLNSGSSEARS